MLQIQLNTSRDPSVRAKAGYTLIEMLVSVSIFSGLLIIVLGAIASSSSSSARVGLLRTKNQAARSLIDQISTDFRFIRNNDSFRVNGFGPPPAPTNCGSGQDNCVIRGFSVGADGNEAILMLHLPNDPANQYVLKLYSIQKRGSDPTNLTLFVQEGRQCPFNGDGTQININNIRSSCIQFSDVPHDLLPSSLVLNQTASGGTWQSVISGLPTQQAFGLTPAVAPFIHLQFTVKPLDFKSSDCSILDAGTCYKVSTTLTAGSSG